MSVENGKLYQDPLYGAKVLSPLAVAVIDSAEFQRLAGLRQLGFSDVMYRGAHHTRFEHSVGTYFLARTIMRRIGQNHERLGLEHPGSFVSAAFRHAPSNSDLPPKTTTHQSRWRGLSEVVSVAALLHDLGHVPFGHTLEDEFSGLYKRHDSLAGPRFYEMLFNDQSDLAAVLSDRTAPWLEKIPNRELARLIYVILNWKDKIDPPGGFLEVVDKALGKLSDTKEHQGAKGRIAALRGWFVDFEARGMFHPFMSDIIGNTICADLLDYLPRDRQNLGMEPRFHTRLQRYLTIRSGTLYPKEGLRVSIMVTRKGRGGQRRDVATAVLDIMRERYEMAERVFYHHKKAAASSMLAKLVELVAESKPRDDDQVYPVPWGDAPVPPMSVPHMTHLSDSELIDYLAKAAGSKENGELARQLHAALRYKRKGMYRTLLVIDTDLVKESRHSVGYFARDLRGDPDKPTAEGRIQLENALVAAANAKAGEVIVYCPSPDMQSKEVDARVEILEGRVLPLRVQQESFAYRADVEVLQRYYEELWRAYIFVAPALFSDAVRCKAIVDTFCEKYSVPPVVAYRKVRKHDFVIGHGVTVGKALAAVEAFIRGLPFRDVPSAVVGQLLRGAGTDAEFLRLASSGADTTARLTVLFDIATLARLLSDPGRQTLGATERAGLAAAHEALQAGKAKLRAAARQAGDEFSTYERSLLEAALALGEG